MSHPWSHLEPLGPDGRPITVSQPVELLVPCGITGTSDLWSGAREHPVRLRADWTVETPPDLDTNPHQPALGDAS